MAFIMNKNFLSLHGRVFGLFRGLINAGDGWLGGDGFQGVLHSVSDNLTAVGSSQATGLALTTVINRFTTVAASTAAVLPVGYTGQVIYVINDGASPLQVYGNATAADTIDGVATATGVTITNARRSRFICTTGYQPATTSVAAVPGVWVSEGVAKST